MRITAFVLKFLNLINILSLFTAIPLFFGFSLFKLDEGTLTENICVNQVFITLIVNIVFGVFARCKKLKRPETGWAIIKESSQGIRVIMFFTIVCCIIFAFVFHLNFVPYLLVCFLQAIGIMNCSRLINLTL